MGAEARVLESAYVTGDLVPTSIYESVYPGRTQNTRLTRHTWTHAGSGRESGHASRGRARAASLPVAVRRGGARARAQFESPQSSPTHRRSDRRGDGVTVSDETQLIGYPPRVRVVTQGPGTLDGGDRVYLPTLFVAPALVLVA